MSTVNVIALSVALHFVAAIVPRATAGRIQYELSDVYFSNGNSASGSFWYDSSTQTVSEVDVYIASFVPAFHMSSGAAAYDFQRDITTYSFTATHFLPWDNMFVNLRQLFTFSVPGSTGSGSMVIDPNAISLYVWPSFYHPNGTYVGDADYFLPLVSGSVVAAPVPVPLAACGGSALLSLVGIWSGWCGLRTTRS